MRLSLGWRDFTMFRSIFCTLILFFQVGMYAESYNPKAPKEYKILSLSAAIIDHFFRVDEEELLKVTSEKGGWAPIDFPTLTAMLNQTKGASRTVPGGSGANVMKGLAQLGEKCAIVGKVGSDDKGEYYIKRMNELGVGTYLERGTLPTGQAICLVTPDGERTFRTYLGASHSLSDLTLDPQIFHGTELFHIEGYQLVDQDLVIRALKMAKKAQVLVTMDMANVAIVRRHKSFILKILDKYIDIIFCNEYEAKVLTGLPASEACSELSKSCTVAVVTMGERGAWAQSGDEKCHTPAFKATAIDTTGAGDLFESGFLHGYINGASLKKCNFMGALVASYVVKRLGAEIPDPLWEEIRQRIALEGKAFD